jgi:hypothetical protein
MVIANLIRYDQLPDAGGCCSPLLKSNNGALVKFDDLAALPSTSDNNAMPKFCPYHKRGAQCIWGLRGCCGDVECTPRAELRQ